MILVIRLGDTIGSDRSSQHKLKQAGRWCIKSQLWKSGFLYYKNLGYSAKYGIDFSELDFLRMTFRYIIHNIFYASSMSQHFVFTLNSCYCMCIYICVCVCLSNRNLLLSKVESKDFYILQLERHYSMPTLVRELDRQCWMMYNVLVVRTNYQPAEVLQFLKCPVTVTIPKMLE